jgi:hypothetical protein
MNKIASLIIIFMLIIGCSNPKIVDSESKEDDNEEIGYKALRTCKRFQDVDRTNCFNTVLYYKCWIKQSNIKGCSTWRKFYIERLEAFKKY